MSTLQLSVPSMACSACADTISNAVHAIDPDAVVQADPKTKAVSVETSASDSAVKEAIANAGYPVS
ncbi:MAG: heavy-metal-associated domain-containing protein [Elainellaceae cyanobacterium]